MRNLNLHECPGNLNNFMIIVFKVNKVYNSNNYYNELESPVVEVFNVIKVVPVHVHGMVKSHVSGP